MSIFNVLPNAQIPLEIFYIQTKEGSIKPLRIKSVNLLPQEMQSKIKTAKIIFKKPNYALNNAIRKASIEYRMNGDAYINQITLQDQTLKTLLVSITDGDGETLVFNDKNKELINELDPDFAESLYTMYQEHGTITAKDIDDADNQNTSQDNPTQA